LNWILLMARTEVRSGQIKDGDVRREDLDTTTSGQAVITKLIAGSGITIDSSTGIDSGTGDVTISSSLPVISNNTYLQWRNAADDANLNILKVDTNDDTVLNATASKNILIQTNETSRWIIDNLGVFEGQQANNVIQTNSNSNELKIASGSSTSGASGAAIFLYGSSHGSKPGWVEFHGDQGSSEFDINFGIINLGSGSTSWQANSSHLFHRGGEIRANTSDGADSLFFRLSGGGSFLSSRGAVIIAGGNESAFPGEIRLLGGNVSGANILIQTSTTEAIDFGINNAVRWSFENPGDLVAQGTQTIRTNTSDGADNARIQISGGGAFSSGRGASIAIHGNESSGNTGNLVLSSGSAGTVKVSSFAPLETNVDIIPAGTNWNIRQNVTNGRTGLLGGSSTSDGGYIELFGDTHASTGRINIIAGDVAGAELLLQTPASEPISFAVGAAVRFKATGTTFEPHIDSSYTLGSPTKAFSAIYVDSIVGPNIVQSLNGLTNSTQTFATGTSGSDFNISSAGSTHTFSIPDASSSARGLVTSGAQTLGGDKTFANNVIVDGNLTVNGTTTTVNTQTVEVADNIILVNSDVTGTPTEDGGLEIERGTETNAQIIWDESEDKFAAGLVGSLENLVLESQVYTVQEVTGTSQAAAANKQYITNNASLVTVTLPSSMTQGERIRIIGKGAGGWRLAQNSGQTIQFGTSATTTGASGYLESNNTYDVVEIICITDNTDFVVISSIGNITVT
jgi:hypothetical protein